MAGRWRPSERQTSQQVSIVAGAVRRRVRFGGVAALAALWIAEIPAVSYSAAAGQHRGQYATRSSESNAKSHKRAKKCKKDRVSKNRKCDKKSSAPEALSATLIVHVYESGGVTVCAPAPPKCRGITPRPNETRPLRISRFGRNGEVVSSIETKEHTVHVAPGKYEIVALGRYVGGVDVGFTRRQ